MHHFIYNGKSSADFNLVLSGEETWKKPMPDIQRIQVPGRNGDLLFSNNRYQNVDIVYHIGIKRDFHITFSAFMEFVLSVPGYHRLEDSYHPDVYRMAYVSKECAPKLSALNNSGSFDLTFSCKPQCFLKSGERQMTITDTSEIYNPTLFDARPLLRVYGTGRITVGDEKVIIRENDSYIDLDCDLEDAFRENENMNGHIDLETGGFPVLNPGNTRIIFGMGITQVDIIPRWWQI